MLPLLSWALGSLSQGPAAAVPAEARAEERGGSGMDCGGQPERGGSTSTQNSCKVLLHPGSASGTPGGNRETTNDLSAPSQPRQAQVPLFCAPTDSADTPWEHSSPVLRFSVDASVFLRPGTVFICLSAPST